MQKKIIKLGLALSMLVGTFAGIPPRAAVAQTLCQDICCDPFCSSVRQCRGISGRCVCSNVCIAS